MADDDEPRVHAEDVGAEDYLGRPAVFAVPWPDDAIVVVKGVAD